MREADYPRTSRSIPTQYAAAYTTDQRISALPSRSARLAHRSGAEPRQRALLGDREPAVRRVSCYRARLRSGAFDTIAARLGAIAALAAVSLIVALAVGGVALPLTAVVYAAVASAGAERRSHDRVDAALAARHAARRSSGSGLAIAGFVLQGMLRNPLVDPFLTGVSAGAAAAIAVAVALGAAAAALPPLGFVAGLGTALLVAALARRGSGIDAERLILAGVSLSALFSAIVAMVLTVLGHGAGETILAWLAGSLAGRGYPEIAGTLPYWLAGVLLSLASVPALNVLRLGHGLAGAVGVDLARSQWVLLVSGDVADRKRCVALGSLGVRGPHRSAFGAAARRQRCAASRCPHRRCWASRSSRSPMPRRARWLRRSRSRSVCCSRSSACRRFCTCICGRRRQPGCGEPKRARAARSKPAAARSLRDSTWTLRPVSSSRDRRAERRRQDDAAARSCWGCAGRAPVRSFIDGKPVRELGSATRARTTHSARKRRRERRRHDGARSGDDRALRAPRVVGLAPDRSDDDAVSEALERVGLSAFSERAATSLSSGERSRLWLALALAQGATTLLLDEPTSHLDARFAQEVLGLLERHRPRWLERCRGAARPERGSGICNARHRHCTGSRGGERRTPSSTRSGNSEQRLRGRLRRAR